MSETIDRPLIHPLTDSVARYAAAARGAGTCRAYASQWSQFVQWCQTEGFEPFSGESTIALHIAGLADSGYSVSTIDVRMAAIQSEYRQAGVPLNMGEAALASTRQGIARTVGTAARRKAAPAVTEALRAMLGTRRPASAPQGARDRALLLVGFGAALRRSELVGLRVGDISEVPGQGLRITVRRSKTDQLGAGLNVYVVGNPLDAAMCPVVAWRNWGRHRAAAADMCAPRADQADLPWLCSVDKAGNLQARGLSDRSVANIVKASAQAAGFDAESFSGHSLRRGFLTAAAENGADLKHLMGHGRHADPATAMGYIDEANAWVDNASARALGVAP